MIGMTLIYLSGNRRVRFTVRALDEPNTVNVCGPYTVEMYIDENIYALSWNPDFYPLIKLNLMNLIILFQRMYMRRECLSYRRSNTIRFWGGKILQVISQ